MRPFASTISLEEARRRLKAAVCPIERTERVALIHAAGRVAAAGVTSRIDVPAFARATMDGYAVSAADTAVATPSAPVRLRLIERIFTGQVPRARVASGTCTEIATGAPMPDGADGVVAVEETAIQGELVEIRAAAAPGQNVGRRAADIAAGESVIRKGDVLIPSRLGALAAVGEAEVTVFAKPRVAILSTGNEVLEPGEPLETGHIYDVNRFTLAALVEAHGGRAEPQKPAQDSLEALEKALAAAGAADLIVFSGGSSVGNRDLVTDLVAAHGKFVFHGIAVKPGKPTAFALIGQTPFFGMPGNPTSCLSNAYVLLIPFLRETARLPPYTPHTIAVPLGRRIASSAGRHQFYTVRLRDGAAFPAFKGSGDITSLSQADGYIEIPEDRDAVEEGTVVTVTLF